MKRVFLFIFLTFTYAANAQNIGIGTTSPKYPLHLHTTGHTVFNITDGTTGDGSGVGGRIEMLNGSMYISNWSGNLALGSKNNSSLFISDNNLNSYVGINNPSPQAPLHVSSNPGNNEGIRLTGLTPYMSFWDNGLMKGYLQAANGGFEMGSKAAYPINFYTSDVHRMTILGNGNVGIGINNPTSTLHVENNQVQSVLFAKNLNPNGWGIYAQTDVTGTAGSVSIAAINNGGGTAIAALANSATSYALQGISDHGKAAWLITNDGTGLEVHSRGINGKAAIFKGINTLGNDQKTIVEFSNAAPKVSGTFPFVFQVTATGTNSITIPNTTHANSSTDMLFIQHAGVAANVNTPVYVKWDGSNWIIYTESGAGIPLGEIYNVMVIKQ